MDGNYYVLHYVTCSLLVPLLRLSRPLSRSQEFLVAIKCRYISVQIQKARKDGTNSGGGGGGGGVPEGFHSEGIFLGAGVLSEVEFPSFEFHKNCFLSFHWGGGGGVCGSYFTCVFSHRRDYFFQGLN